mmetsp:Transcript_120326/g.347768  ORF Transcript_120326/g.347768 Transcript_120326/m.347768 type:complete len:296 (+) Transcript_120326:405-1292(+)
MPQAAPRSAAAAWAQGFHHPSREDGGGVAVESPRDDGRGVPLVSRSLAADALVAPVAWQIREGVAGPRRAVGRGYPVFDECEASHRQDRLSGQAGRQQEARVASLVGGRGRGDPRGRQPRGVPGCRAPRDCERCEPQRRGTFCRRGAPLVRRAAREGERRGRQTELPLLAGLGVEVPPRGRAARPARPHHKALGERRCQDRAQPKCERHGRAAGRRPHERDVSLACLSLASLHAMGGPHQRVARPRLATAPADFAHQDPHHQHEAPPCRQDHSLGSRARRLGAPALGEHTVERRG